MMALATRGPRTRPLTTLALVLALLPLLTSGAAAQPVARGQKIVMATHSFNVFIGPNRRVAGDPGPLAKLAAEAGKQGHEMLAVQMIGGSTPMQHWDQGAGDDARNIAKAALNKGGVDVFTMSPNARMPEEGIDLFGDLVRQTNSEARILVQASWSAWDGTGTTPSVGGNGAPSFTNDDHDKATIEQLRGWRNPEARYRVALRTQLQGINARAGKPMAFVVPSSDAVYTLREYIIRGEVPGIAAQHEIFADAMGHPRPPIVDLVSYVWFAAMYRQSPVGLKALVDANDPTSAPRELLLQQIAWNAIVAEPMSGVSGERASLSAATAQQPPARPMSPEGSAQVQVLGTWAKGPRPAFTLGREVYQNGKWIEIIYGRPLQRGRDLFGSGANYGKAANDVGAEGFPPPPVWRAGANISTRLKTEVPLLFGKTTVPAGEYTVFIDLKQPEWTMIISTWPAQMKFDPKDKTALWGAYGYTPDKDVVRVPMKLEKLPFEVDQLTWTFLDMKNNGGRVALMWGNTLASTTFTAVATR
jgi:hypothetical protein